MARVINFRGGSKMPSVFDVANYFLKIVDRDSGSSITHLKLQKLVYYAQAWHLVFTGEKMFNEEIQAWVHGPVCPELFKRYADFKYDNLPEPDKQIPNFDDEEKETLEAVWDAYGDFDGKYLEELTHEEEPWLEARKGYAPGEHCQVKISTDTMKEYYSKIQYGEN